MNEIKLPELGEGIEKATIAAWHVQEGDPIHIDDDVVEVVTDKASFNVICECEGIVKKIHFHEGQEAKVGAILADIQLSKGQ